MALSAYEEQFLREQIAEKTPMKVVNPNAHATMPRMNSKQAAERAVDEQFRRMPATQRLEGGPDAPNLASAQERAPEDLDFMSRVDHVLLDKEEGPTQKGLFNGVLKLFRKRRKESQMEFISRTGLSPIQAKSMTKDEITRFVATVMRNKEDFDWGGIEPKSTVYVEPQQPGPLVTFVDTGVDREPQIEPAQIQWT